MNLAFFLFIPFFHPLSFHFMTIITPCIGFTSLPEAHPSISIRPIGTNVIHSCDMSPLSIIYQPPSTPLGLIPGISVFIFLTCWFRINQTIRHVFPRASVANATDTTSPLLACISNLNSSSALCYCLSLSLNGVPSHQKHYYYIFFVHIRLPIHRNLPFSFFITISYIEKKKLHRRRVTSVVCNWPVARLNTRLFRLHPSSRKDW